MVNFTEQVYFEDMSDLEELEKLIYKWTPLKTERRSKMIDGTVYPVLKVFYDEAPGMHNWCPNDDWTYPSKDHVVAIGYTQPDFFKDILPGWEVKFDFEHFEEPRKTQKEIEEENKLKKEFEANEEKAISDAEFYIFKCENYTAGSYKECIRDAFCPFAAKFIPEDPAKAIEKYKNKLLNYIKDMPLFDIIQSGIIQGLESVFLKQGW
jgi:hypothetical protein